LNTQSGSHHAPDTKAYVAFAQNARDEVRLIGGDGKIAGALAAQPGMKQTTYVAHIAPPITSNPYGDHESRDGLLVVGALACNTGPKGHDAGNFACNQAVDAGHVVPVIISEGVDLYNGSMTGQVAATFNASSGDANHSGPKIMHTTSCIAFPAEMSATQSATTEELAPALSVKHTTAVAYAIQAGALRTNPASGPDGVGVQADHAYTLEARAEVQAVAFQSTADCLTAAYATKWNGNASATNGSLFAKQQSAVRRLTPVECERLQGFPDGFTAIPWGKKAAEECPDGPRYKALGNSMAVPVMRWIGERIQLVDDFVSLF